MTTAIELTKEDVKRLKFVNEAKSRNNTRPILGCVNMNNGVAAAADGFRAHIVNMEITDNDGNPLSGVRALNFAKNILLAEDEDEENPRYPDISAIVPHGMERVFTIDPYFLASGLKHFDRGTPAYFLVKPATANGVYTSYHPVKIIGLVGGEPAMMIVMPRDVLPDEREKLENFDPYKGSGEA